jgi:hypothetical protein
MLKNILAVLSAVLFMFFASYADAKSKADTDYSIAYINDFEGECEIKSRGNDIGEAIQDLYQPLYAGDTVSTESGSSVEIVFDDSTILKLDPDSRLIIKNLDRKDKSRTIVEIFKGKVLAIVKKLMDKEEFTVKTKMAMAAVKGTEFIVDASDDNSVGVYEGAVEVSGLDMEGRVLHKIILGRDQETIITKKLRRPGKAGKLRQGFFKRHSEMKDLRGRIEMMRELRHSGKSRKFKIERRLKRIENLRAMMKNDPEKYNNLPQGQKALVNEILKQEPYLEAQQEKSGKNRQERTLRLKKHLKNRKSADEGTAVEQPASE